MRNWLYLIDEGRITLQVPGIENDTAAPKEWWCKIGGRYSPAVGKESGFEHLTRKGWEDNMPEVKTRYESAKSRGYDRGIPWEQFEVYVENHFSRVETIRARRIALLTGKLDELKSFIV